MSAAGLRIANRWEAQRPTGLPAAIPLVRIGRVAACSPEAESRPGRHDAQARARRPMGGIEGCVVQHRH